VTGLIYVVIIALWAAVLIPVWLRRHDQISEVRSTARFSSAMKSLGSQGQPQFAMDQYGMDQYTVEMSLPPRRSPAPEVRMSRSSTESRSEGLDPEYERELTRQSAATRRALVLGALTLILLVALVLGILSIVPRWAPILAALPVLAFVIATAMTASARSGSRAERAPVRSERRAPARRASAPAARTPSADAVADEEWENWNAWDDDESWDAVPTTLPTYVTAPRASAVPRGIDRSRPGEWTGSAMVETARAMRMRDRSDALLRPPVDVDHGADTTEMPAVRASGAPEQEQYSSRRAVNE
jgi:hypothetical protein